LNNIQETLKNEIGSLFICDNPNRKLTSITGIIPLSESRSAPIKEMHRKLQSNTSVDLGPHTIDTNTDCLNLIPLVDTQKCEVISASITVYTSDDPDLLSNALNRTENRMNEDTTFVNETLGILELHFLVDSREIVTAKAVSPASSSTLSEPALAGVVAGSVLILAVAFLLARSKKSTRRNVSEDFEDDDLSLFSKSDDLKNLYPEGPFSDEDLDGVLLTPGSNRNRLGRGRRARVLNEDDYYLSSPNMHPNMECIAAVEISGNKDTPEDEGFECQRQDELDVHKCSSATCQLCIKRRNTVFEPSFGNHSGLRRIYHYTNTVTF